MNAPSQYGDALSIRCIMLNSSGSYKSLAKKTRTRECGVSEGAVSEVVVDVRSRIFRYMRLGLTNRNQLERAASVFRTMKDIRTTGEVFTEKRRVFFAALSVAKKEAEGMRTSKCTFVFPSSQHCPHRVRQHADVDRNLNELKKRIGVYRSNMFDLEALERCAEALESYIIADFDAISKMHAGNERLLGCTYKVPDESDSFESDRLCARLSRGVGVAVLSEDFDVIALFGADIIIREVHKNFFVYVSRRDTLETFGSVDNLDFIHRCCIMGTDYNQGLKGVGPVKARKIDASNAKELFDTCVNAQSIRPDVLYQFFHV